MEDAEYHLFGCCGCSLLPHPTRLKEQYPAGPHQKFFTETMQLVSYIIYQLSDPTNKQDIANHHHHAKVNQTAYRLHA